MGRGWLRAFRGRASGWGLRRWHSPLLLLTHLERGRERGGVLKSGKVDSDEACGSFTLPRSGRQGQPGGRRGVYGRFGPCWRPGAGAGGGRESEASRVWRLFLEGRLRQPGLKSWVLLGKKKKSLKRRNKEKSFPSLPLTVPFPELSKQVLVSADMILFHQHKNFLLPPRTGYHFFILILLF